MENLAQDQAVVTHDWTDTVALQDGNPNSPNFPQLTPDVYKQILKEKVDAYGHIPVTLTVELGRATLPIKTLLMLSQGSVVELMGVAGEPMDILVNGVVFARGEVVVVNEKFGIRFTDLVNKDYLSKLQSMGL